MPTAARAQRRLLADVRQPGPAAVHPRPAARGQLQRHDRRPGLLPRQHHSGRAASTRPRRRCSTCSRCPTPRRPATNFNNYTFQTVQDWPRNDQVLRVDYNIAQNTTMYGRLQFGYEKRAGGGLVPRLGRRMAAAAEQVRDRHGQLRQHAAAHLQPDALRRGDGRRELGAPVHQRVRRRGARRATTARIVLPGLPQFFPQANPDGTCCRTPRSPAARRERSASFNTDNRWPFFGFNTLWNVSGNITKIAGLAQHQGRACSSSTRPARRSGRRPTTAR